MQLAGQLRGQALQEWKLFLPEEKIYYQAAIKALRERLDPGNQTLAALHFCHLPQKMNESVSNFMDSLKKYFRLGLVENICLKRLGKCYFMGSYRMVFHIP